MAKKTRDRRVEFINNLKKNKISDFEAKGMFKYEFDTKVREYVYAKLPVKFQNLVYSTPFPFSYISICENSPIISSKPYISQELIWCFDLLIQFNKRINQYITLRREFEIFIINGQIEQAWTKLEELENAISVSYYGLLSEFYINTLTGESEINKDIINEFFAADKINMKFLVVAEMGRIRIEKNISAWQYDSQVQQHIIQYGNDELDAVEYLRFKLDPINFEGINRQYVFVLNYDSDFALIDRYDTLKKNLPAILQGEHVVDEERMKIFIYASQLASKLDDPYWKNLSILGPYPESIQYDPSYIFYTIQDYYFLGEYSKVIQASIEVLKTDPQLSELYVFLCHSIIFERDNLDSYISKGSDLFEILSLMIKLLRKTTNYNSDREALLKKYHTISHFNYAYPILEFLHNEYRLNVPKHIQALSHLNSKGLKYNFYKLLADPSKQLLCIIDLQLPTFAFITKLIEGKSKIKTASFLQQKLYVGYLINNDQHNSALNKLYEIEADAINIEFVETWLLRNFLKCFIQLQLHEKAADYITNYYINKKYAYDHFVNETLFEILAEMTDEYSNNISNPILFHIYNQPQSLIYDTIANFLILNDVKKPSELIPKCNNWSHDKFLYFIERCCTKDNIEDSPYLYTIEQLEEERITLLNFLKDFNSNEEDRYNAEILKITREASIRKGLMQIHESRIYVDDRGISKQLETDFPDLFDRYIELTDITHIDLNSLKFNEEQNRSDSQTTYYYKKTIENFEIGLTDIGIQHVPAIRFTYFKNLFDTINFNFVFSEDYGFKSFLSMRIRHGTFSNMLRSVYEKHFLISSKEVRTDSYQNIKYWNEKLTLSDEAETKLQNMLKLFSRSIDDEIDKGLSWLSINNSAGMFDFIFSIKEMTDIFINRLGRISEYNLFVAEVFKILFERLEENLNAIRNRIIAELLPKFILMLEDFQRDIQSSEKDGHDVSLVLTNILYCKTEIQVVAYQIVNWFKISKNQYIEEFPIDLILQTSLDYVNSINRNAINKATLNVSNSCQVRFKGQFFETFGDIFINIFENVVSKNKELEDNLVIDINIECENDKLSILVKNNIHSTTIIQDLQRRIAITIGKIDAYKINPSANSFEKGSGYLKLCKSIAADLDRHNYIINPSTKENNYIVEIKFDIKDLTK